MGATPSTPKIASTSHDEAAGSIRTLSEEEIKPLDAALLNAFNKVNKIREASDVVVIGGGLHSLIYAIHLRTLELDDVSRAPHIAKPATSITIFEKSETPSYKIGESTLSVFGFWLKQVGIGSALLYRLFAAKDGLAFYYVAPGPDGGADDYTSFIANGPPGDFVPTLQMERKISELLLTLYAQRLGVEVFHGHTVEFEKTKMVGHGPRVIVRNNITKEQSHVKPRLLIDATGRLRQFASKESRIRRFDGWNTHAYWAYFECPKDESTIPLRFFESCNTNHICIPEGWAWIIRLPSWEGSSIENLTKMINYLLDLNAVNTPADLMPCVDELVKMFDLKFRWVVSIGFAIRSDVRFPEDLVYYGGSEAERKFNWIVSRYPKIKEVMSCFTLINNLYGPRTTYFVHKRLTYQSPQVSGRGWAAIGDAVGFTNPLYSPGINANMATSIYVAETTNAYLAAEDDSDLQRMYLDNYEKFCKDRIPNLNQMNTFNYLCMRSPLLGPLGPLWQYVCGTGNEEFQNMKDCNLRDMHKVLTTWDWGANRQEFTYFASGVIKILAGPPTPPTEEQLSDVRLLSQKILKRTMGSGKYKGRWNGMFRWFDDELRFDPDNPNRDVLARRCKSCGEWRMLCGNVMCPFCGFEHTLSQSVKELVS